LTIKIILPKNGLALPKKSSATVTRSSSIMVVVNLKNKVTNVSLLIINDTEITLYAVIKIT